MIFLFKGDIFVIAGLIILAINVIIYFSYKWLRTIWNSDGNLPLILPVISILSFVGIPATAYLSQSTIAKNSSSIVFYIWCVFAVVGIISSVLCLMFGLISLPKNYKSIRLWITFLGGVLVFSLLFYVLILSWNTP
jgi:hypothetical protein